MSVPEPISKRRSDRAEQWPSDAIGLRINRTLKSGGAGTRKTISQQRTVLLRRTMATALNLTGSRARQQFRANG